MLTCSNSCYLQLITPQNKLQQELAVSDNAGYSTLKNFMLSIKFSNNGSYFI